MAPLDFVRGSLGFTLDSGAADLVAAFSDVQRPSIALAFADALADAAGVSTDSVRIIRVAPAIPAGRRLEARQLTGGTVIVEYIIGVPVGSAEDISAAVFAMDTDAFVAAVNPALKAVHGLSSVEVAALETPAKPTVKVASYEIPGPPAEPEPPTTPSADSTDDSEARNWAFCALVFTASQFIS